MTPQIAHPVASRSHLPALQLLGGCLVTGLVFSGLMGHPVHTSTTPTSISQAALSGQTLHMPDPRPAAGHRELSRQLPLPGARAHTHRGTGNLPATSTAHLEASKVSEPSRSSWLTTAHGDGHLSQATDSGLSGTFGVTQCHLFWLFLQSHCRVSLPYVKPSFLFKKKKCLF